MRRLLVFLLFLANAAPSGVAHAQDAAPADAAPADVPPLTEDNVTPENLALATKPGKPLPPGALEVTSTGTLEWLRGDQMYVARKNAVARRDDTTLKGDVLVAHYQVPAGKKSGSEIVQVTAEGHPVELLSPNAVAFGQHGVYDLPAHLVLLLGDNLKLITTEEVVTAKDSLEYFEALDTGVARGDAVMVRGADKLTADVIAAKFVHRASHGAAGQKIPAAAAGQGADGKTHALERLDAKGHVVLVTLTDVVHGDEGVYNPITDQATIIGNVHVTREDNQLDGDRAEVDMTTGISRVYAAPDARVHGLFVPKKKEKSAGDDQGDGPGDAADAGEAAQ